VHPHGGPPGQIKKGRVHSRDDGHRGDVVRRHDDRKDGKRKRSRDR
jgi:hypothetical protein